MAKKNKKEFDYGKKRYNMYSIFGIIGDIVFYPIIIITLLCCLAIYVDKASNKVPNILGFSMVSISSGSMTKGGFNVKDIVFLKKENPENLRAGDIITFYYYISSVDKISSKPSNFDDNFILIQSYNRDTKETTEYNTSQVSAFATATTKTERPSVDTVSADKTALYFHRIVEVYVNKEGTLFFRTQGDTNTTKDEYLICADYVVGEYIYTPPFIRGIFSFVATTTGMIVLIVFPLGILTMFMLFSIIEQISKMIVEKKVLSRKIRYNSKEAIDSNIGIEMDEIDKIEFFVFSDIKDRYGVSMFLWDYLDNGNPKDKIKYERVMSFAENFNKQPEKFWMFWAGEVKGKSKKMKVEEIKKKWEKAELALQKIQTKSADEKVIQNPQLPPPRPPKRPFKKETTKLPNTPPIPFKELPPKKPALKTPDKKKVQLPSKKTLSKKTKPE